MKEYTKEISSWLQSNGIELEEAFVPALRRHARQFQLNHGYSRLNDVYQLIGTHKANVSYWEAHPHSTQTKNFETSSHS